MPPKPVDIEQSVEMLKSDGSTPEMRANARAALSRPTRNVLPKFGLVGAVASVAIFVACPRATAGRTWAQALQASIQAKIVRMTSRDSDGKVRFERWQSNQMTATLSFDSNGRLTGETRSNGSRVFGYFSNIGMPETVGKNVNAYRFGMVNIDQFSKVRVVKEFEGKLDQFLALNGCEVVKQQHITLPSGKTIRYEVRDKRQPTDHRYVDVDDNSGLIVQLTEPNSGYKTSFDYPKTIDSAIFEPRPQTAKDCVAIDWHKQQEEVRRTVDTGISTSTGIRLRLAALDSRGNLWILWSGKDSSENVKNPFKVAGIKLGKAWSLPWVSPGAPHYKYGPEMTTNGQRLYGMCREATTKVGDNVDVSVPTKKGTFVEFKSVPVMRIGLFEPSIFVPKKNVGVPTK